MKFILLFTFLASLAVASETINLDDRAVKLPRKQTYRPGKIDSEYAVHPASKPADAPAGYTTSTDKTTLVRPAVALQKLPKQYIDAGLSKRRESFQALKRLRQRQSAADFFECYNSVRLPLFTCAPVLVLHCFPRFLQKWLSYSLPDSGLYPSPHASFPFLLFIQLSPGINPY